MRLTVEFDKFIQASTVWVSAGAGAGAGAAGANLGHAVTIAESEHKPSNESNSRGKFTTVHSAGRNKQRALNKCDFTFKILLYLQDTFLSVSYFCIFEFFLCLYIHSTFYYTNFEILL